MTGTPKFNMRAGPSTSPKPPIGPAPRKGRGMDDIANINQRNLKTNVENTKTNQEKLSSDKAQEEYMHKLVDKFKWMHNEQQKLRKVVGEYKPYLKLFADASPQLKLQTQLLQRSFTLLIRPFGDMVANLIRPFVRTFLRMSVQMYKFYHGFNRVMSFFTSTVGGGASAEDKAEQLLVQRRAAEERGDDLAIQAIDRKLDELSKRDPGGVQLAKSADAVQQFETYLPNALVEGFGSLDELSNNLWSKVQEFFPGIADSVNEWWNEKGPTMVGDVKDGLSEITQGIAEFFKDEDGKWFPGVRNELKSVTDGISSFLMDSPWAALIKKELDAVSKTISEFISAAKSKVMSVPGASTASKIGSWIGGKLGIGSDSDPGNATGGVIPETGVYKLHAGERVVPAGQARNTDSNVNITNNFTIHASINNNVDIQRLASELESLQHIGFRRRVSY